MTFTILEGDYHIGGTLTADRFDIPFKDTFRFRTVAAAASREVDNINNVYLVDSSAGDIVITLPLSVPFCDVALWIKKTSLDNLVTVMPQAGEMIDRKPSCIIQRQYTSLTFLSDGFQWWVI